MHEQDQLIAFYKSEVKRCGKTIHRLEEQIRLSELKTEQEHMIALSKERKRAIIGIIIVISCIIAFGISLSYLQHY